MSDFHLNSQPSPVVAVFLIVIALVYLRGWFRLRSAFHAEISPFRLAAFISGIVTVWIGIASPLAALDHHSLTVHMVKHLLLMTVSVPLLLAGAHRLALLSGLPSRFFHGNTLLASGEMRGPDLSYSTLLLCWLAGIASVVGWHLPIVFQLSMRSQWAHSIEDISFLVAGFLFWWPIARSWPSSIREHGWGIPLYLFLATLPCDILSAFLVFCNRVVYAHYLATGGLFGMSALQDQECAGALMWVWVTFVYLVPAVAITLQLLSPSNRPAAPLRA